MKKNKWIPLVLLMVLLAAGFLGLQSAAPIDETKKATCSKESLAKCSKANKNIAPGEMIMESISRQFLSIATFPY